MGEPGREVQTQPHETRVPLPKPDIGFVQRVLVVYAFGALFLLLIATVWFATKALLLAFASILVAILLSDASRAFERLLGLTRKGALGVVMLLVLVIFGLAGWLLAPQVVDQTNQLISQIPDSIQRLREYLERHPTFQQISRYLPPPEQMVSSVTSIASQAGGIFSGLLGAIGNALIILFVSVYLAAQPQVYLKGIVKLLPPDKRPRGWAVLNELAETLSLWLRGKLVSMAVVGVATATGLTLLGVPLGLALGLLAGLLDFIPYIGPILAAVPSVLIAFSQSPSLAFYVVLLFIGIQILEGYLLLPLVERKAVSLPPAMTITMQVLMGLAFGLTGIALATPFTAVLTVLVAMLYVEEALGDQVTLPTEKNKEM